MLPRRSAFLVQIAALPHLSGFPGGTSGKESVCQCRRCKKHHFDPWVRKMPWRRKWHLTLVFLPGKSHGQNPWGSKELDVTEQPSTHTPTPATPCMDFSFTLVDFPSKPYNHLMCCVLCAGLFTVYLLPPHLHGVCVGSYTRAQLEPFTAAPIIVLGMKQRCSSFE